jgi:hypothetical protein
MIVRPLLYSSYWISCRTTLYTTLRATFVVQNRSTLPCPWLTACCVGLRVKSVKPAETGLGWISASISIV